MSFGQKQRLNNTDSTPVNGHLEKFDIDFNYLDGPIGNDMFKTVEEFSDESLFGEDRIEDLMIDKRILHNSNIGYGQDNSKLAGRTSDE